MSKILALMRALKLSRAQVFRLIKSYRPEIGPVSIEPLARGPKAGSRQLSAEIEEAIQHPIDQCIKIDKEKFTYTHVWKMVVFICNGCGLLPLSLETVRRRCKDRGEKTLSKRIHGAEHASNEFRPKLGGLKVESP